MKVVLHMPNEEYASKLMAKGLFYILRNRIDRIVNEKDLTNEEKADIYEYLLKEIEKDINR